MPYELGIIGAGNMAEAIARGVLGGKIFSAAQILAADVSPQRRQLFQAQLGIASVEDNLLVARQSKRILLSVKPYAMPTVLAGLGQAMDPATLVISIAAGISTKFIGTRLGGGKSWRVVRSMPNTPMLVGQGMVAIAPGAHATKEDLSEARRLFASAATVIELSEEKIDAVTALSGSGPAYFFFLVEQMIAAGIELGLSQADARLLAIKTAAGAAKMMSQSPDSPQELRSKVTTPGGTTHAAIAYMEANGWPKITIDAIQAAAKRSREMGS